MMNAVGINCLGVRMLGNKDNADEILWRFGRESVIKSNDCHTNGHSGVHDYNRENPEEKEREMSI